MNEIANQSGEEIRDSLGVGRARYADYLFRIAIGESMDVKFLHDYYCRDLNEGDMSAAKRMAVKRLRIFAKEKK